MTTAHSTVIFETLSKCATSRLKYSCDVTHTIQRSPTVPSSTAFIGRPTYSGGPSPGTRAGTDHITRRPYHTASRRAGTATADYRDRLPSPAIQADRGSGGTVRSPAPARPPAPARRAASRRYLHNGRARAETADEGRRLCSLGPPHGSRHQSFYD